MSIRSFPVDRPIANKMIRVMAKEAEAGTTFDVVLVHGTDKVYIRENHGTGGVTMHGREEPRAEHVRQSRLARSLRRIQNARAQ